LRSRPGESMRFRALGSSRRRPCRLTWRRLRARTRWLGLRCGALSSPLQHDCVGTDLRAHLGSLSVSATRCQGCVRFKYIVCLSNGGRVRIPLCAEVTKSVWVYIKKSNLNQGRIIKPDAKLKKVFPVAQSPGVSCCFFFGHRFSFSRELLRLCFRGTGRNGGKEVRHAQDGGHAVEAHQVSWYMQPRARRLVCKHSAT
jgi:hypothetical protein